MAGAREPLPRRVESHAITAGTVGHGLVSSIGIIWCSQYSEQGVRDATEPGAEFRQSEWLAVGKSKKDIAPVLDPDPR